MVLPQFLSNLAFPVLSYWYQIRSKGFGIRAGARLAPVQLDSNPEVAMPEKLEKRVSDNRVSRRAKIARPVRVRPSEPRDDHFEDLPISVNASKTGIYFTTRLHSYYPGMRVFVTFPFTSAHDPMNCEYVAQVVRVEKLENGKTGVAVNLKMSVNFNSPGPSGSGNRR
jgi:PilZ domain